MLNELSSASQLSSEEISFAQRVHFVVTFGSVSPVALSPTFHASAAFARKEMKMAADNFILALGMLRKDKGQERNQLDLAPEGEGRG